MKNRLYIGIIIASVLLQKIFLFWEGSMLSYKENFLLSGVPYYDDFLSHNLHLMLWLFPIIMIIHLFNGEGQQLYQGYGILRIIRGESRCKVIVKKVADMSVRCFGILFLYAIIMQESVNFSKTFWQSFLMFYVTLMTVLFFQFTLEHMIAEQNVVFTVVLVSFTVSVMLSNVLRDHVNYKIWQYVVIPNFAFAQRNGIMETQSMPNSYGMLWLLCGIMIGEIAASMIIANKKDLI